MEDEDASRAYLLQVWAEAMTVYRSGHYSMKFSKSIQRQLVEVQKDFMPEDTEAGQIHPLSLYLAPYLTRLAISVTIGLQ